MKRILLFTLLVISLLSHPHAAFSTEEYAAAVGKDCGFCHVSPEGGGELTSKGKLFKGSFLEAGAEKTSSRGGKLIRLVAGFLHLLTAILWFGTILYVHLLLKPEYASHGLPKGELAVGWGSIIVIFITGAILTSYRVKSIDTLLETTFGRLLLAKILLYLVMVGTAAYVTFVLGPKMREKRAHRETTAEKSVLTLEELETFDGSDGGKALIAYDGDVYDVTKSPMWRKGIHAGKHRAGSDLTDLLNLAPHGEEVFNKVPKAGKLVKEEGKKPKEFRIFYFLAYMNLVLVILIIMIIAAWRW